MDTQDEIALLYRRGGFGTVPGPLSGPSANYGQAVAQLIKGLSQPDPLADAVPVPNLSRPPYPSPKQLTTVQARKDFEKNLARERLALMDWWIGRMIATGNPLREKLTFFLHCHFPTAVSKVRFPFYMYRQNQIFRTQGPGDFASLTASVATDAAMLIWLDAATDRMPDPNENFARELMERFTMGIGTYSEMDVRAAAFAFTGWHLNPKSGLFAINPKAHDRESVTFLGNSGVASGRQVIDIVTHSPACADFVVASLWSRFAYPIKPADPLVKEIAAKYSADRSMTNLLDMVFRHPMFLSSQSTGGLVKQPVEYVVGALRALGVTPSQAASMKPPLSNVLASMGQIPFDPPSVGGWPQNEYWLSTSAALARWRFAHQVSLKVDVSAVADAAPASRIDALGQLVGIRSWSSSTRDVLVKAGGNPHELLTFALVSPEYILN